MNTNGIEHNLKVGALVWSLNCTQNQIYEIVGFTKKRVVCKEVGIQRVDGIQMLEVNLSTSNHSPENLFEV